VTILKIEYTLKYCSDHVRYSARSLGVAFLGTRVIEGAAFSSVKRSTNTAINGSDKMAGTIHPVSQSNKDVTSG
jgi:hypothetical protein